MAETPRVSDPPERIAPHMAANGHERRQRSGHRQGGSRGRLPHATAKLTRLANIKLALLVASVLVVLGTLMYAHSLVTQLRQREYLVVKLFSDAVKYYSNSTQTPDDSLYRMITHYAMSSDVPVILTDRHDVPSARRFHETNWNVPYDSTLDSADQVRFLREQMHAMDRVYPPIAIYYRDSALRRSTSILRHTKILSA